MNLCRMCLTRGLAGWIAIGAGIGAAFGAGDAAMGPAVAYGVAAGVVGFLLFSKISGKGQTPNDAQ